VAAFAEQLLADFQEFPSNGKAHQRVIRERMAEQPDADIAEKRRLAADFKDSVVREISYDEAKNLILGNEWLGNMEPRSSLSGCSLGVILPGRYVLDARQEQTLPHPSAVRSTGTAFCRSDNLCPK
jgi:hypothetical protein